MKAGLVLVIILMTAFLLSACAPTISSADTFSPVPPDYAGKANPLGADAAAPGAVTFASHCEPCHGVRGKGDGPAAEALDPHPANLPSVAAQVGDDYLFWRISQGRPGTAMVAWGTTLTEEQIWQVIAFIHTLK